MVNLPRTLLLVEDDENFGSVLKAYLEMSNYIVLWAKNGKEAFQFFDSEPFDICVFDIMLPHIDGFDLAKKFRTKKPDVPFIFLTARKLKEDIIKGFKLGADDYITKPFDSEILLYKLDVILSRGELKPTSNHKQVYNFGNSNFDCRLRKLTVAGNEYKLSPKESDLLKMLIERINDILSREDALNAIWGHNDYFTTRSMDVFVTKLRKYLSADCSLEIVSIHGSGFILKVHETN